MARACERMRDRRLAGSTHVVSRALWNFWEMPRMGPRVGTRYPMRWPWSPDARARYEVTGGAKPSGGWGLVHEHVRPRGLLVAELIERARQLTVDALIDHLNAVMAGAVITKDEDAALLAAGVARKPLIAEDPDIWARYRAAGLDPETFAPLVADVPVTEVPSDDQESPPTRLYPGSGRGRGSALDAGCPRQVGLP